MSDKFELDIKLNTTKKVSALDDDKQPLMNKNADYLNNSN
jgi:hypothetical protein